MTGGFRPLHDRRRRPMTGEANHRLGPVPLHPHGPRVDPDTVRGLVDHRISPPHPQPIRPSLLDTSLPPDAPILDPPRLRQTRQPVPPHQLLRHIQCRRRGEGGVEHGHGLPEVPTGPQMPENLIVIRTANRDGHGGHGRSRHPIRVKPISRPRITEQPSLSTRSRTPHFRHPAPELVSPPISPNRAQWMNHEPCLRTTPHATSQATGKCAGPGVDIPTFHTTSPTPPANRSPGNRRSKVSNAT